MLKKLQHLIKGGRGTESIQNLYERRTGFILGNAFLQFQDV